MSRFIAAAAAIALVVSGMAIGGLGTYLIMTRGRQPVWAGPPPGPGRPPGPPMPFTHEMEFRLDLTAEQRRQIDDILRAGRDESDAIRRELRPRLESHLAATREKIAGVLTPEQRKEFEKLVEEDKRRSDRFLLEGPPGGPPPGGGPPF